MINLPRSQTLDDSAVDSVSGHARYYNRHHNTTAEDVTPAAILDALRIPITHRRSTSPTDTEPSLSDTISPSTTTRLSSKQLRIIGYTLAVTIPLTLAALSYIIACASGSTLWLRPAFLQRWSTVLNVDTQQQQL